MLVCGFKLEQRVAANHSGIARSLVGRSRRHAENTGTLLLALECGEEF